MRNSMDPLKVAWSLLVVATLTYSLEINNPIKIIDGGYTGLTFSVDKNVPENPRLLQNLKELVTKSSKLLWDATRGRAFYKEVDIILPSSWNEKPEYDSVRGTVTSGAHVFVAETDPRTGNAPFTIQPGRCGEPGKSIHLSADFVEGLNDQTLRLFGLPEKQFIHEFGHFRYGLFDEYGIPGHKRYPSFYLHGQQRKPTTCVADIHGWAVTPNGDKCKLYEFHKMDPQCRFIPAWGNSTAKASLMYHPYIDSVDSFCESNPSHPSVKHDWLAPTKQNVMCGRRSSWDVIMAHKDFAGRPMPPIPFSTVPQINVKRAQKGCKSRFVLLLDTSGSMSTDVGGISRIKLLEEAAKSIIEDIPLGHEMGIVGFSSAATLLHEMTIISGKKERSQLSEAVPRAATGGTAIGLGFLESLRVLRLNGGKTEGSTIILVSDGGQNHPTVEHLEIEAMPQVRASKIKLITLALGKDAHPTLNVMAKELGGSHIEAIEGGQFARTAISSTIQKMLRDMVAIMCDFELQPVPVAGSLLIMPPDKDLVSRTIIIDKDIGLNTTFLISSQHINDVVVEIISPEGQVYDKSMNEYTLDSKLSRVQLKLGDTRHGKWSVRMSRKNPFDKTEIISSLSVTSSPRGKQEPVLVRTWIDDIEAKYPNHPKVYADIKKGKDYIVGAKVMAYVEDPKGDILKVSLFDNGKSADTAKDDGLYSAYVSHIKSGGRHSVSSEILNDGGAKLKKGERGSRSVGRPAFDPSTKGPPKASFTNDDFIPVSDALPDDEEEELEDMYEFEREQLTGSFNVIDFPTGPSVDIVPPSSVDDLSVVSTDKKTRKVRLEWTASGDNYTEGMAAIIEMRVSRSAEDLVEHFEDQLRIDLIDASGGTFTILNGTETQQVLLDIPEKVWNVSDDKFDLFFALRSIDASGNQADVSNIAIASFGYGQKEIPATKSEMTTSFQLTDRGPSRYTTFTVTFLSSNQQVDVAFRDSEGHVHDANNNNQKKYMMKRKKSRGWVRLVLPNAPKGDWDMILVNRDAHLKRIQAVFEVVTVMLRSAQTKSYRELRLGLNFKTM